MRKTITLTVLVLAVAAYYLVVQAGRLEPPGPPAPTDRVPIFASDLPLTISSPGSYFLAEDIAPDFPTPLITIAADHVTIDLRGFTLASTDSAINATTGSDWTVLKNGFVRGFFADTVSLGRYARVIDVGFDGEDAALLTVDSHALVRRCTFFVDGGSGVIAGAGSRIEDCTMSLSDADGVQIADSCVVSGNTFRGTGTGIVGNAYGCLIAGNVHDNVMGIAIEINGYGNQVIENTVTESEDGIEVTGARNRIEANHITDAIGFGLKVNSAGNVVIRNTVGNSGTHYSVVAGNFVGTIVSTETAMNAATNDLVNIEF